MKDDLPERSEVIASVGDHSRRVAHEPIANQVDRLRRELKELANEKARLETELSHVDAQKQKDYASILGRRLSRRVCTEQIALAHVSAHSLQTIVSLHVPSYSTKTCHDL